jgi:aspartate/methionine/tyrosine aminotransferase
MRVAEMRMAGAVAGKSVVRMTTVNSLQEQVHAAMERFKEKLKKGCR